MKYKAAPGVFDILPKDPKEKWRCTHIWQYVESVFREVAKSYGFQEIRTPAFERTELFARGVGETTDIVSKEMYTFEDRGGRMMSLRPEGTAPVMRAYIEHQLQNQAPVHKLFYIEPMFRYERQQAGRYRQHHQVGFEAIGNSSPEQDAEVIDLCYTIYQKLGLKDLQVMISTLGDTESRLAFKNALVDYLKTYEEDLSEDSKVRLKVNPLRILDSKDPKDQEILRGAPSIHDFLTEESQIHFKTVCVILDSLGIRYEVNKQIVRGLDYYNQTVFEVTASQLGAQNSIGGGGRYDGLIKELGGPDVPATGFATGIERIIQTMLGQGVKIPDAYRPVIFLIPLGSEAKATCIHLLKELRTEGVPSEMDYSGRKLGKVMHYANQIRAQYVAVIGEEEIKNKKIQLKEMETGDISEVSFEELSHLLYFEQQASEYMNAIERLQHPFETIQQAEFFMKKLIHSIEYTKQTTGKLQEAIEKMKEIL